MLQPWCGGSSGDFLYPSDHSPIPGEPASHKTEPNSPICALTRSKIFGDGEAFSDKDFQETCTPLKELKSEKRYLGVRVKMPVRDMLRKIRIAKGMDPLAFPGTTGKTSGEKKRVHSSRACRNKLNKKQIKSLEDLSIIVEVLEEDLKASKSREPSSMSLLPGLQEDFRVENAPFQNHVLKCEHGSQIHPPELSAAFPFSPGPMSTVDLTSSSKMWGGCYADNMEDVFSSTQHLTAFSDRSSDWLELSPQASRPCSPTHHNGGHNKEKGWAICGDWMSEAARDWDGKSFFWFQLQKEEMLLRTVSDDKLLAVDHRGRTLLHSAVTQGKRALAFVIAKRMTSLNNIDIRDVEGRTALHLSAQRNQHLMVADLLLLGASVNARDRCGKTCLHLSAENGYFRVLEVLRHSMNDGLYVDVHATDLNGLTALQCATAALNTCMLELERSVSPSLVKLHMLRKEQLLDTLDSLLHMGSCLEGLQSSNYEARTPCRLRCTTCSEHSECTYTQSPGPLGTCLE